MRTEQKRRKDLKRERAWRKANKAAGLRCDGRPLAKRKPCGCLWGSCLKCRKPDNKLMWSPEEVAAMWAFYCAPNSLSATARQFKIHRKSLNQVFARRGLELRPPPHRRPLLGYGVKIPPATPAEIRAAIAKLKHVNVPPELKREWRNQTMAWRMKLLRQIRAQLQPNNARPAGPFSANVTPWTYGTPAAMELAAKMNAGRNSQTKVVSIRASSEGLIWDGRLWFWTARASDGDSTGYLSGAHSRGRRLPLHHAIWQRRHRREVPAKHTVIFLDGNKNNFEPENFGLRSMADCARMNSIVTRLKKDPRNPVLIAKMQLRTERILNTRSLTRLHKGRNQTAALVQSFQTGGGGLLTALQTRRRA